MAGMNTLRLERVPPLTVADLPAPPPGRSGWPWTEGSPHASAETSWPRLTIVTPSFNQGRFIEETIRSVLLQGYPDLEYIVMDGGSTDETLEILHKYDPWLTHWSSGPDGGQSDAINRGFRLGTGEIMAWLNSDDIYFPGALQAVAGAMMESGSAILLGVTEKVEITPRGPRFVKRSLPWSGKPIHPVPILRNGGQFTCHFIQPSTFWTRDLWDSAGELDERYHYVMDLEWLNRALARGASIGMTDAVIARFAMHPAAKTQHLLPRALLENALMFWRLGQTSDFNKLACCLAALYPLETSIVLRARQASEGGRPLSATTLRIAARGIRAARSALSAVHRQFGSPRSQVTVT